MAVGGGESAVTVRLAVALWCAHSLHRHSLVAATELDEISARPGTDYLLPLDGNVRPVGETDDPLSTVGD